MSGPGNGGLEISIDHPSEGTAIVTPSGELDLSNGDILFDALEQARRDGVKNLVIDLRTLTFMDSSGLRLLLDTWNESKLADRRLSIVVAKTGLVHRVLEVSGCDTILPIVNELSQAL